MSKKLQVTFANKPKPLLHKFLSPSTNMKSSIKGNST